MANKRQIDEIIKSGKDPVYFFNKYAKIQHPVEGLMPFRTYPFQEEAVKDFLNHKSNVILKARQLGISTLVAAYAVWLAIFYPDKNILVIATKLSVAQNFIKKVKVMLRNLPKWIVLPTITGDNKQSVEFSNRSSIKAVPTSDDAGRSEALSLLIVDEAAFIRNFDELWTALQPTMSTGGRTIILSTPNGVGNMYHKIYTDAEAGLNEFNPIKLMWDVHPERDEEWFEEQRRNLPSRRQVAQELLCDFLTSGETFLTPEDIEWIGQKIEPPIDRWGPDRNFWVWEYPLTEGQYIMSADVARGDSQDYSAAHVIDVQHDRVVAEYKGKLPPDRFAEMLDEIGRKYNTALAVPENNSFGYATIMKLKELQYPRIYHPKTKSINLFDYSDLMQDSQAFGFNTSGKSRPQILAKLEEILRNKQIEIKSSRFYDEIKTFVWTGGRAAAQKGRNDDLVLSLAIGLWIFDASGNYGKDASILNEAMFNGIEKTNRSFHTIKEGPPRDSQGNGAVAGISTFNPFAPFDNYRVYRGASEDEMDRLFGWVSK
jgi:hypothetical protein